MKPTQDQIVRRVAEVRGLSSSSMLVALFDDRAAAVELLRRWLHDREPGASPMLATDTEEFIEEITKTNDRTETPDIHRGRSLPCGQVAKMDGGQTGRLCGCTDGSRIDCPKAPLKMTCVCVCHRETPTW